MKELKNIFLLCVNDKQIVVEGKNINEIIAQVLGIHIDETVTSK